MLHDKDVSTWHRLKSDEIWFYHDGTSNIQIYEFDPETQAVKIKTLGKNSEFGFSTVVKKGTWFGSKLELFD